MRGGAGPVSYTHLTSVATLVCTLVMMLSISPLMTLISLVILPVSMILISFVIKHSQKYFRQQQEYLGHINGPVSYTHLKSGSKTRLATAPIATDSMPVVE